MLRKYYGRHCLTREAVDQGNEGRYSVFGSRFSLTSSKRQCRRSNEDTLRVDLNHQSNFRFTIIQTKLKQVNIRCSTSKFPIVNHFYMSTDIVTKNKLLN